MSDDTFWQPVIASGTGVPAVTVSPELPAVDVIVQPLGGEIVFWATAVAEAHDAELPTSQAVTEYFR